MVISFIVISAMLVALIIAVLVNKIRTLHFVEHLKKEIINRQDIKREAVSKLHFLRHHRDQPYGNVTDIVESQFLREHHVIDTMNAQIKTLRFIALYSYDFVIRNNAKYIIEYDNQENYQMLAEHARLANIYDQYRMIYCEKLYKRINFLEKMASFIH